MFAMWKRLKTAKMRIVAMTATVVLGTLAFTIGVGAASLKQTIEYHVAGTLPFNQVKSVVIQPTVGDSNPTTLRVEILRNNKTLCSGVSSPKPDLNGSNTEYSITTESSMSDCPTFRDGDVVKATFSQTNEVNLSYDKR